MAKLTFKLGSLVVSPTIRIAPQPKGLTEVTTQLNAWTREVQLAIDQIQKAIVELQEKEESR